MVEFDNQRVIANFHFRATIDGQEVHFKEISGLEHEVEVIDYRQGQDEVFRPMKRAAQSKWPNLVMKKGVFETDDRLIELFHKLYDKEYHSTMDARFDILVELLDETSNTVMSWNFVNAFPVKLGGIDLKSDANEAAIESIEFVHEGLVTGLA